MMRRVLLDVALVVALVFLALLLLTIYRVQNICRNAPQACSSIVVVPQQSPAAKPEP